MYLVKSSVEEWEDIQPDEFLFRPRFLAGGARTILLVLGCTLNELAASEKKAILNREWYNRTQLRRLSCAADFGTKVPRGLKDNLSTGPEGHFNDIIHPSLSEVHLL